MKTFKKDAPKPDFLRVHNLVSGAFIGALTGASLMSWWFADSLSGAGEITVSPSYFFHAARLSCQLAFGFGSVFVVAVVVEIFRVKKEFKATLESRSQPTSVG